MGRDIVVLIHTGECAFNAPVNVPFIPLENTRELWELCVSDLFVPPVLWTGVGSRLGAEVCLEVRDLLVVRLPRILIVVLTHMLHQSALACFPI